MEFTENKGLILKDMQLTLLKIEYSQIGGFTIDFLGGNVRSLFYLNKSFNSFTIQLFFREFNF